MGCNQRSIGASKELMAEGRPASSSDGARRIVGQRPRSGDSVCQRGPRRGAQCPRCGEGRLDYDGLLNLVCPRCHYVVAGAFT